MYIVQAAVALSKLHSNSS